MSGIYATLVLAKVIDVEAIWDWADKILIRPAMRRDHFVAVPERAIPAATHSPDPLPAGVGVTLPDLCPEPVRRRSPLRAPVPRNVGTWLALDPAKLWPIFLRDLGPETTSAFA